jgi:4-amino-4-deoxy-L-arabinose transferase-like glycosyltransferase
VTRENSSAGASRRGIASGTRAEIAVLGAIILIGIVLRVWTMARANWMLDGDEATFGLMALHILQGERPVFLNGQPYMGAFQSYLGAAVFTLFGASRAAFKSITLFEFIAFALSLYLLARTCTGRRAALLAVLFAAIPPIYVLSATARGWGALFDAMTLGNLILLLAINEAYATSPPRRPWLRFFTIGVLGGFGFWLHGMTLIYLGTAAILLFFRDKRVVFQPRLVAASAGFLIGAAPVFAYALKHDYTTFHYLLGVGRADTGHQYLAVAYHFLRTDVPMVSGVAMPWMSTSVWLQIPVVLTVGGAILALIVQRRQGILGWPRLSLRHGRPVDALLLFVGLLSVAFVFSAFGRMAVEFPNTDATGRYAAPLASVLPIILATGITRLSARSRILALAVSLALIGSLASAYIRSAPADIWQSPYWRYLPPSNAELISTLDSMGINAVWMNHWAGTPLMFDSQDRISAADDYDLSVGHGIDRLPEATSRVRAAELPAFVFVTDQPTLEIEDWLKSAAIPYDKRVIPQYVIIRPHQHVKPGDVVQYLSFDH